MANIDKDTNVFIGFQGTSDGCAEINSTDLAGNVTVIYGILKGDQFDDRSPSVADNIFTNFNKILCGSGCFMYTNNSSNFNVPNFVDASDGKNTRKLSTLYPHDFTILNVGIFHLTSGHAVSSLSWINDRPIYRTLDGGLYCWYDGSSYCISNEVGSSTGKFINGSCLPNSSYGDGRDSATESVEISGFTGGSASANGIYEEVGYINGKPLYRNGSDCSYMYYWDGSKWVLTNSPVTTLDGACFISGTSEKFGTLASNGNCFEGQTGRTSNAAVDPRSLATESEEAVLATEDKKKVLITEAN